MRTCVCVCLCVQCLCVCVYGGGETETVGAPFHFPRMSPPPPCLTDAGVVEVWGAGVSGEEDD